MKRLLNPKLNSKQETVLNDTSSNEEPEIGKINIKSKKKAVAKASSSQPAKVKGLSQSVKELRKSESELFAIFLEIRNELIKQHQKEKAEIPPVEDQEWEDEDEFILRKSGILKNPNILDLLNKDTNLPEIPDFEQEIMTGRSVDIDKENLQKIIQQYKQQMKHMQEVNEGLMMANRNIKQDLQDVNEHCHELTAVSKVVLKRKGTTDLHCSELEKTVKDLQQRNEELTKKITDLE